MRRRVVITGMGVVTPLGTTVSQLWANLKESKSGVDFTTLFDASNFPTRISAEVRNWSLADAGEEFRGIDADALGKHAGDDRPGRHRSPRAPGHIR